MENDMIFTLIGDGQEMAVRYRPHYFSDYAQFEFMSCHQPRRRIPVSEMGYRSHFVPMHSLIGTSDVEECARMLATALMEAGRSMIDNDDEDDAQMDLF